MVTAQFDRESLQKGVAKEASAPATAAVEKAAAPSEEEHRI